MTNINILDNIIETARTYSTNFGAFQIIFEDGSVLTCKTPAECEIGMYTLQYMKKHPESYKNIDSIKLPEEEGTTYWMREAYGKVS